MANIATVSVLAILREDGAHRPVTARSLLRALTTPVRRTYCVPIWMFDDYPNGRVYLQYGAKWSPSGVEHAWERFGRFLTAVWVRWFDEGGDHDAVYRCDAAGLGPSSLCRYGFDAMQMTLPEAVHPVGDEWQAREPSLWEAGIRGSYLAGNDRCGMLSDRDLPMPTLTTPTCARRLRSGDLRWAKQDMPSEVRVWEPFVAARATEIAFVHGGRIVRLYRRQEWGWFEWLLDDWDNCTDSDWLVGRLAGERA